MLESMEEMNRGLMKDINERKFQNALDLGKEESMNILKDYREKLLLKLEEFHIEQMEVTDVVNKYQNKIIKSKKNFRGKKKNNCKIWIKE